MELIALWRMFLRRWWLILLPAVVVAVLIAPELLAAFRGGSAGGGWTVALNFSAALPTSGDEPTYEDAGYFPWLASEYVVNALADWVRTGSFAREVSAMLAERGLQIEPGAIRAAVAADNARSVMQLYLSWADGDQIGIIAQTMVDVLQQRSAAYFPQFAAQPVEVILLDEIAPAPAAPPVTDRVRPLLKVALGLAAGVALAALAEYLDDSLRRRDEVEEALALPVLGEIPKYRGG